MSMLKSVLVDKNFGSGDSLVAAFRHQAMLTQICCHMTSLGNSELNDMDFLTLETEYSGFWASIPCLLMRWLLQSPDHQQARYWLCRTDNMYCCFTVNFIY